MKFCPQSVKSICCTGSSFLIIDAGDHDAIPWKAAVGGVVDACDQSASSKQTNTHTHTHTHTLDVEMIVPLLHLLLLSRSSLGFLLSRRDVSSVFCRHSSLQISQKATDAVPRLRSSTTGDPALLGEKG